MYRLQNGHLGHTSWFFETFVLLPYLENYRLFNSDFAFIFNSYYETEGKRVIRAERGNLSRPTVASIYEYRKYIDVALEQLFSSNIPTEVATIIETGIHHEKQHQELLLTDIKYILGHNPILATYKLEAEEHLSLESTNKWIPIKESIHEIGHKEKTFSYDNELGVHKVYLEAFKIASKLVSNKEYMAFIAAGAYRDFQYWHAEAWDWIQQKEVKSPMYWHFIDDKWQHYTLTGLQDVNPESAVTHISYFEAYAYAQWAGFRLPTEFEWEAAHNTFNWGSRWEWTESSYLPYPNYKKAAGALGEYNGKFMVNQKVLRGASFATPDFHSRSTYRNFFQPHLRWQYTGIRLAQ